MYHIRTMLLCFTSHFPHVVAAPCFVLDNSSATCIVIDCPPIYLNPIVLREIPKRCFEFKKEPFMPKHTGHEPLDDHLSQPSLHTTLNVPPTATWSASNNNRRNLSRYSRTTYYATDLVRPQAAPAAAPPTIDEYFPIPSLDDDITMVDVSDPLDIIEGPSGITVVSKQKAKRYENSVSMFLPLTTLALLIRHSGCALENMARIPRSLPRRSNGTRG